MLASSKRAVAAGVLVAGLCWAASAPDAVQAVKDDVQLRAMWDEMQRTKTLALPGLEKPYFVRYALNDAEQVSISASLGGIVTAQHTQFRQPDLEVRVGSYAFDNTNSIYSRALNVGPAPLDDDYTALRDAFWLASDTLYKVAAVHITTKRNALRDVANADTTPDFAVEKPFVILRPPDHLKVDVTQREDELRRLSRRFEAHPNVLGSEVQFMTIESTYRLTNTEGAIARVPEGLTSVEIKANALAPDGRPVRDSYLIAADNAAKVPSEQSLTAAVDAVAQQTEALRNAPMAEDWSGPVLFERQAAAQLIAELMADAARLTRKPVAPPGANAGSQLVSVWASRVGTNVTPGWISIEDDPSQEAFHGEPLIGHYEVDDEGVPAQHVTIVDKGMLKGFLMSREPVRNWNGSNGHGRLPGSFETEEAVIGNLFVHASQTVPEPQMKQKLIDKVKTAGLQYGLLIRKLDFPSTSTAQEIQELGKQAEKSGYMRTITPPLLAYRVYPDGREELVRGVRFGEFSAKDLRDLAAASDRPYVLNYINKGTAFNFADLGSNATMSSVICPSLLFDSVDTERADDQVAKSPLVPPPALSAGK